MEIIKTITEMQSWAEKVRGAGLSIAFVPTMGFFHDGHLALMSKGRRYGDKLVVSIFVNPAQFGPGEDFEQYPRDLENDLALAEARGADVVFAPENTELYPAGFETYVMQSRLPEHLCGLSRPGHFKGVMTIVAKLFNIVKPDYAVFGQKDFQQLAVLRRMTKDLNFDTWIIDCPTVRESDGLALSSRNKYLTADQRQSGLTLYRALTMAQNQVDEGQRDTASLIKQAGDIIRAAADTEIDYITICDPETLEDLSRIERPALMALAVKVGSTRLIDNTMLHPK
ncbi:MAG: pantoate--beta-alanine ligase [Thermodesulfobacteriota bacterium]